MAEKQLVIVVEGTAAMAPHWSTIVSDYLHKIIRSFCSNEESNEQKKSHSTSSLALVTFHNHRSLYGSPVLRSPWTRNVDIFLKWLSTLPLIGDAEDVAIAEGLSEALVMLNDQKRISDVDCQRHCILIAASDPYLYDAETFAKFFSQRFVSLSVISPRQTPKLRAIYNAGKRNPEAVELDEVNNPNNLVLISENFFEARTAFNMPTVKVIASCGNNKKIPTPEISQQVDNNPRVKACPVGMSQRVQTQPRGINNKSSGSVCRKLDFGGSTSAPEISQPVSTNNNSTASISTSQQPLSSISTSQPPLSMLIGQKEHFLMWEGKLYGRNEGQPEFVTVMHAYRGVTTPANLAHDWPATLHMLNVVSYQELRRQIGGCDSDLIFFRVQNEHMIYDYLAKHGLLGIIELPSQKLYVDGNTAEYIRLAGRVFSKDVINARLRSNAEKRRENVGR